MADKANIDAYFERIGFSGSIAPSLDTLTQLVQLHLAAIPFENLDSLLGAPVRLELANLQQKLLFDRRGGYCLEHALLLKAMLEELDYEVKLHSASVLWARTPGETAERPPSHLLLTVTVAGASYLADVGFGGKGVSLPLRLRSDIEQPARLATFRLTGGGPAWQLDVQDGEDWQPLYRFAGTEAGPDEVAAIAADVAADRFLLDNLTVARVERDRRLGLLNLRFNTYTADAPVETRMLTSVAELRDVLAGPFGLALPPADRLDPVLQRIVERDVAGGA